MLVVIALGDSSLLRRNDPLDAEVHRRNIEVAAAAIASIADTHEVVVTHGNGPQVGMLARQGESAGLRPYALNMLDAEGDATIGYVIEHALSNRLPQLQTATLLTQVEVDPEDAAFCHPSQPVGPVFKKVEADRIAETHGWSFAPHGEGFRRVLPSPKPRRIVELATIRLLIQAGALVICAGGGGIPVVTTPGGGVRAVDAVIDKDLAAALLALDLRAKALLLLTDVDAVYTDWTSPDGRVLRKVTPQDLRSHSFPTGTIGPKVQAACRFVEASGGTAGIGRLQDAAAILAGNKGTVIRRKWAA